uniref:Putative guanylylate cyclase n=1 Tax=viral metagenome TaxID=1070528 RepID=A0A6M3LCK4_9ZZZZ
MLPAFMPVMQRLDWDCGVVCLIMLLNVTPKDAYAAARACIRNVEKGGIDVRGMKQIARRLRKSLIVVRDPTPEQLTDATGILYGRKPRGWHYMLLFQGVIYDPSDGVVWDLDEACRYKRFKPRVLLLDAT